MNPASEMRRAARALVERQSRSFSSDYPIGEACERLRTLFQDRKAGPGLAADVSLDSVTIRRTAASSSKGEVVFMGAWTLDGSNARLDGEFLPPAWAQRVLKLASIGLALLIGLTVMAFATTEEPMLKASLALLTGLGIFALPIGVLGLSSHKAAAEATIGRALQLALKRPPD